MHIIHIIMFYYIPGNTVFIIVVVVETMNVAVVVIVSITELSYIYIIAMYINKV